MAFRVANALVPDSALLGSAAAGAAATRAARLQTMSLSALPDRRWFDEVSGDAEALGAAALSTDGAGVDWSASTSDTLPSSTRTPLSVLRSAHLKVDSSRRPEDLKHLLELSLSAPTALERVVSAQALDSLAKGSHVPARDLLHHAARSTSPEVKAIASLSSVASPGATGPLVPDAGAASRPSVRTRVAGAPKSGDGPPTVSATVHGTWARLSPRRWWAPGEPLHTHIRTHASDDLYAGEHYFRWTSAYDDAGRWHAGTSLVRWVSDTRGVPSINTVYAHSHGGNVALSAAAQGLKIDMLVLMHTPPRRRSRDEWAIIRQNVARTMVYRVGLDRVVLADLLRSAASPARVLGQRFDNTRLPHVDSEPHPINGPWFDHGFFTRVENWQQRGIADDVAYYRNCPPMS